METKQVKVWDPLVRIFHWSLVLSFATAYLTGEIWEQEEVHEIAGYAALGLILFRIIWGFIGSKHARFSDFLYGPKAVIEYLKSLLTTHPKHYLGHNPAGGWMVVLLLLGVLATGITGLKLLAVEEGEEPLATLEVPALISTAQADNDRDEARERGERPEIMGVPVVNAPTTMQVPAAAPVPAPAAPAPAVPATMPAAPAVGSVPAAPAMQAAPARAGEAGEREEHEEDEEHEGMEGEEEGEEFWEEAHEIAANLTLLLVILHVLGVIVSSRLHRENLARAMVTGKKDVA